MIAAQRQKKTDWQRNRLRNDPEYRERQYASSKRSREKNPGYKVKKNARQRITRKHRRSNDMEFRQSELKRDRTARKLLKHTRMTNGLCSKCESPLQGSPSTYLCKACHAAASTKMSTLLGRLRQQVLEHYGRRCSCPGGCEIAHDQFLTLDHVGGWRIVHPNHKKRPAMVTFLKWIISNNFPPSVRVLCMNCNWAMRFGEPCAHSIEVSKLEQLVGERG